VKRRAASSRGNPARRQKEEVRSFEKNARKLEASRFASKPLLKRCATYGCFAASSFRLARGAKCAFFFDRPSGVIPALTRNRNVRCLLRKRRAKPGTLVCTARGHGRAPKKFE